MAEATPCTCPEINDQDWHNMDQNWTGKFFYFEDIPHVFNVPVGYDKKLQQMKADIQRKGYQPVNPDMVLYLPGTFQGRVMMEIKDPEQLDANVEQFDNARMLSRVFRGARKRLGDAISELKAFTQDRAHIDPVRIYFWQVTCPKCEKQRGGNKTVLFGRV
ncbi:MAG: hypothetical protein C4524_13335 [Candidatus Zixiibacteriota bacterium]|nr:MAG: hypothetical protein C4524_13335 [candidate division Zixibacteria bacterium]